MIDRFISEQIKILSCVIHSRLDVLYLLTHIVSQLLLKWIIFYRLGWIKLTTLVYCHVGSLHLRSKVLRGYDDQTR